MIDDGIQIVRSLPEIDAAINGLEKLALSTEARSPFEDRLIDLVTVLAKSTRHYLQHTR